VAISVEFCGVKAGGSTGASFFMRPGRKKLAGETLWLVLMPLQPVNVSGQAASAVSHKKFQHNLTCRV
jgi:hypothetical protein